MHVQCLLMHDSWVGAIIAELQGVVWGGGAAALPCQQVLAAASAAQQLGANMHHANMHTCMHTALYCGPSLHCTVLYTVRLGFVCVTAAACITNLVCVV